MNLLGRRSIWFRGMSWAICVFVYTKKSQPYRSCSEHSRIGSKSWTRGFMRLLLSMFQEWEKITLGCHKLCCVLHLKVFALEWKIPALVGNIKIERYAVTSFNDRGIISDLEHMGVSKNRGTSKSSILIRCSIINHPFWGKKTIFGNIHQIQHSSASHI